MRRHAAVPIRAASKVGVDDKAPFRCRSVDRIRVSVAEYQGQATQVALLHHSCGRTSWRAVVQAVFQRLPATAISRASKKCRDAIRADVRRAVWRGSNTAHNRFATGAGRGDLRPTDGRVGGLHRRPSTSNAINTRPISPKAPHSNHAEAPVSEQ